MTRIRRTLAGLATVAALAAGATLHAAQPDAGAGPGASPHGGPGAGHGTMQGHGHGHGAMGPGAGHDRDGHGARGHGRGAGFSPAARMEGRLAALKTELGITAGQESGWQAFAAKAKGQLETMQARRGAMATGAQTAPDRMAQRAAFAKQRAASLETMSAAVRDLYEALTPEQKKIADERLAFGRMGRHGGERHRAF